MQRNSTGEIVDGSMSEFDKLPKALRVALANADHNWSGEQLHRVRRNRKHPRHHVVATIPLAVAFIQAQDKARHDADAAAGLIMGGQR